MASAIPPPHIPFALGTSSLLNVPRPGAPVPFPLPLPPPSTAVFPPLGSSYLPDDLALAAFSLFFVCFWVPLFGSFDVWRFAVLRLLQVHHVPHHIKHPSPPLDAVF
jgi:hypothetical protein